MKHLSQSVLWRGVAWEAQIWYTYFNVDYYSGKTWTKRNRNPIRVVWKPRVSVYDLLIVLIKSHLAWSFVAIQNRQLCNYCSVYTLQGCTYLSHDVKVPFLLVNGRLMWDSPPEILLMTAFVVLILCAVISADKLIWKPDWLHTILGMQIVLPHK